MKTKAGSAPDHAAYFEELIRLRTQAGMTRRELAERLGIKESAVTRGEGGARRVGIMELQRWAFACGSTLEEFGRRLQARTRQ